MNVEDNFSFVTFYETHALSRAFLHVGLTTGKNWVSQSETKSDLQKETQNNMAESGKQLILTTSVNLLHTTLDQKIRSQIYDQNLPKYRKNLPIKNLEWYTSKRHENQTNGR